MTTQHRPPVGHAFFLTAVLLAGALALPGSVAASVTAGRTFSVASQSGLPATGTHFHSDHAGALGNPPDLAEVGSLQDQALSMEECRGLTEFDLTGLASGTATLTFNVFQLGGLFAGQNDFPFTGNIAVLPYTGNNADDISDYSIAPLGSLGTFSTAPLIIGSPLSFNVTSVYNAQLAGGAPALGFRLQITPSTVTGGGAFTFHNFNLTVTPIPEPAAASLLVFTAFGLLVPRRRR